MNVRGELCCNRFTLGYLRCTAFACELAIAPLNAQRNDRRILILKLEGKKDALRLDEC